MHKLLFREYIYYVTASSFVNCFLVTMLADGLFDTQSLIILFIAMLFICTLQLLIVNTVKNFAGSLQLAAIYIISAIVSFLILLLLFRSILMPGYSWKQIAIMSCVCIPFQLSILYYTKYRSQAITVKQKEQQIEIFTSRQKIQEIEVLKQQIDPHFIFNSFNTLSFLIGEDSTRAQAFSDKLANVYRYIIFNGNKNLIGLSEELEFSKNYSYLIEIRHSNEVEVKYAGFNKIENILIIPVSIQLLIENAIKHNQFSESLPLIIHVKLEERHISVENIKRLKLSNTTVSSKIGLANLKDRCQLIMQSELIVLDTQNAFTVKVPIHRH